MIKNGNYRQIYRPISNHQHGASRIACRYFCRIILCYYVRVLCRLVEDVTWQNNTILLCFDYLIKSRHSKNLQYCEYSCFAESSSLTTAFSCFDYIHNTVWLYVHFHLIGLYDIYRFQGYINPDNDFRQQSQ